MIRETPNVVLIEWQNSLTMIGDEFKIVWWARIPIHVIESIDGAPISMVMHWHKETLHELYQPIHDNFEEFTKNVKSILVDHLPKGTNRTVFIFGTQDVLNLVERAICSTDVLPEFSFKYSKYTTRFKVSGEIYFVYKRECSNGLVFVKANCTPIQNFVHQLHLKK